MCELAAHVTRRSCCTGIGTSIVRSCCAPTELGRWAGCMAILCGGCSPLPHRGRAPYCAGVGPPLSHGGQTAPTSRGPHRPTARGSGNPAMRGSSSPTARGYLPYHAGVVGLTARGLDRRICIDLVILPNFERDREGEMQFLFFHTVSEPSTVIEKHEGEL